MSTLVQKNVPSSLPKYGRSRIASMGRLPMRWIGLALTLLTALLIVDALVRDRGAFDYWLINTVQRVDFPFLQPLLHGVSELTGSFWAITLWAALFLGLAVAGRWLAALVALAIPIGGGINLLVGQVVQRSRPEAAELHRAFGEKAVAIALRVPDGDYRDWDEIGEWASKIGASLVSEPVPAP